ncbi:MAG TPA: hypothetical protein VEA40_23415 [Ramlibacter sp.]|nr:hypothetical protein [Ramlibacter sp.]
MNTPRTLLALACMAAIGVAAAQAPEAFRAAEAGYRAYAQGDYAAAIEQARTATARAPEHRPYWVLLAQALAAAGRHADALQAAEEGVRRAGADPALEDLRRQATAAQAQAAGSAMYRALQDGNAADAVARGREAARLAPRQGAYRIAPVHALLRQGDAAAAEAAAREALAVLPDDATLKALHAIALQRLARGPEAVAAWQRALEGASAAQSRDLRLMAADAALAAGDLGVALEWLRPLAADDRDAAPRRAALRSLQAQVPFPEGSSRAASGVPGLDCSAAESTSTCALRAGTAPADPGYEQAAVAYRRLQEGQPKLALPAARLAAQAAPDDPSRQQLWLQAAQAAGEPAEAERAARGALALASLPPLDRAYLSIRMGDHPAAREAFAQADAAGALPPGSLADAGYAALREGQHREAVAYFQRVVDAQERLQLKLEPQLLYETRRAVAELSREWGLYASVTHRGRRGVVPGFGLPTGPGGNRVTQAGAEVYWRPRGWRDGRYLELFARGFGTLRSDLGGATGDDSLEGGVGLRYKPLREHNLVFSFSRVFSRPQRDDWLVQAAYSLDLGTDLRMDRDDWWTTRFSAEAGRFLETRRHYGLATVQAGRSWLVGDGRRTVLFPHVAVAGEYDSGALRRSAVAAGPGVALRHWFREDRYAAPRSYVEFTVQYRAGLGGDDRARGWYLGTLLSY